MKENIVNSFRELLFASHVVRTCVGTTLDFSRVWDALVWKRSKISKS